MLPKLRCGCGSEDPAWYTEAALAWIEPDLQLHRQWLMPSDYPDHDRYRSRPDKDRVRGGQPTLAFT